MPPARALWLRRAPAPMSRVTDVISNANVGLSTKSFALSTSTRTKLVLGDAVGLVDGAERQAIAAHWSVLRGSNGTWWITDTCAAVSRWMWSIEAITHSSYVL